MGWQDAPLAEQKSWRDAPKVEKDQTLMEQVDAFARGPLAKFAQGATFGFYDEMRGRTAANLGSGEPKSEPSAFKRAVEQVATPGATDNNDELYRSATEQARGELEEYAKEHPYGSLALEMAGGMATGIPGAARAGATRAGQWAARNIPAWMRLTGAGAAGGATAGAGYSEEGNRGRGAMAGAALGAATGATLPLVVRGVSAPFRWASPAMRSPRNRAYRKIAEAMDRDSISPERVQANLRKMGPQATVADAAGENVLNLADTAVQLPGQTRNRAIATVNRRQAGQSARVMDTLTRSMGNEKGFYSTLRQIGRVKRANAAPLYDKAYSVDIPYTDNLKSLASRPTIKNAMGRAMNIAMDEGDDLPKVFRVENGKAVGLEGRPNMKVWDYIKRGLDEIIESNTGEFGKVNAAGRRALMLKNQLLGELDEINPSYAQARRVFADEAANESALKMGRQFIRQDADITEELIDKMSESEAEFFRAGAMRAIRDKLESASDTADAYKRIFNNQTIRNKLRSVFPDDRSFAQFARKMQNEAAFYRTRGTIQGNSATARRLANQRDIGEDPGAMSDYAIGGVPYAVTRKLADTITRAKGLPENVADEVGQMVFSQDPNQQQALLRAIQGYMMRRGVPSPVPAGAITSTGAQAGSFPQR